MGGVFYSFYIVLDKKIAPTFPCRDIPIYSHLVLPFYHRQPLYTSVSGTLLFSYQYFLIYFLSLYALDEYRTSSPFLLETFS